MSESRKRGRPRCAGVELAVLEATLEQLAEQGYSRMSIDAVALAAGTTKPTIYRRWSSKESLAVAALAHLQTKDEPQPSGDTRTDLIQLLTDFQKKLLRPNGMAMIGTLLAEEIHLPELIEQFRKNIVQPRRAGLLAILEAGRLRGEFRQGVDLEIAVSLLVGSFYARYLVESDIPATWSNQIVDLVLAGLKNDTNVSEE